MYIYVNASATGLSNKHLHRIYQLLQVYEYEHVYLLK